MSFAPFDLNRISSGLAFGPSREELFASVAANPAQPLVIQAPPGSGKTTIVPPTVANAASGRVGRQGHRDPAAPCRRPRGSPAASPSWMDRR